MDIVKAIETHYADMTNGVGFIVGTDAYGNQVITYWDTTKHPLPSQFDLALWWTAYLQVTQKAIIAASAEQDLSQGFTSTTFGKSLPLDPLTVANLSGEYAFLQHNSTATPKQLRANDGTRINPTQTQFFSFSSEARTFIGQVESKVWDKEDLIESVSDAVIPTVLWNCPTVPQGLTATAGSTAGTVSLAWTANPDKDLASYNVYQDGAKVGNVTTNSDSLTGLASGTEYTFTVSAVDTSDGESAQCSPVTVTAP